MEVRTIRDCIDKKSNNLNLIKFIAAILVISAILLEFREIRWILWIHLPMDRYLLGVLQ